MPQENEVKRDTISILHTDKYSIDGINGTDGLLNQIADYELILTAGNVLAIKIPASGTTGNKDKLVAINTLNEEAVKGIKVDNALNADRVSGQIGEVYIENIFATDIDNNTLKAKYAVDATYAFDAKKEVGGKIETYSIPQVFYGSNNPSTSSPANAREGDIYIQHE